MKSLIGGGSSNACNQPRRAPSSSAPATAAAHSSLICASIWRTRSRKRASMPSPSSARSSSPASSRHARRIAFCSRLNSERTRAFSERSSGS